MTPELHQSELLQGLPRWALEQASSDLFDVDDPAVIVSRASEIVHEAIQIREERHDEYDDPDQGGEG